jgi:hypothetical protein
VFEKPGPTRRAPPRNRASSTGRPPLALDSANAILAAACLCILPASSTRGRPLPRTAPAADAWQRPRMICDREQSLRNADLRGRRPPSEP